MELFNGQKIDVICKLQVRDLVTVVIPMREISVVEKVDNSTNNVLPNALLVTSKRKVRKCDLLHTLV